MWIVLNKSFLSIVENRNNKIELLVRSRVKGDIEKVFSEANVFEDNTADYKYRSYIDRKTVANTISKELMNINYDNFDKPNKLNRIEWPSSICKPINNAGRHRHVRNNPTKVSHFYS